MAISPSVCPLVGQGTLLFLHLKKSVKVSQGWSNQSQASQTIFYWFDLAKPSQGWSRLVKVGQGWSRLVKVGQGCSGRHPCLP
jgi:hypothetical protein